MAIADEPVAVFEPPVHVVDAELARAQGATEGAGVAQSARLMDELRRTLEADPAGAAPAEPAGQGDDAVPQAPLVREVVEGPGILLQLLGPIEMGRQRA